MAELFLEIVELENGEVVLREMESDDVPVMRVSFSDDMKKRLQDQHLDVAKVMLSAGIHMAAEMQNKAAEAQELQNAEDEKPPVLH